MTPDQLRALADALSVPHYDLATVDVIRAADYLRAQADAQPAPAVPQAEPKREPNPDEVICPACTHQFRAIPENVQAQLWAKREPLSDEQINEVGEPFGYFQYGDAQGDKRRAFARAVERAHRIGGSDAE